MNHARCVDIEHHAAEIAKRDKLIEFYRDAVIDLLHLEESISDDRSLIVIGKDEKRGWVAWHAEYPEEGSIGLSGDDAPDTKATTQGAQGDER